MLGKILILGGTGTLGVSLVKNLKGLDITILSRDEQKQYKMKKQFPNIKYVLGDIRDKHSISQHFKGVDTVFHVAALKHIDIIEENPIESIKTNIIGTINACECAIEHGVEKFMFSSTDKAVDPINVYGYSKAISEKIVLDFNKKNKTIFSVFRWGNILGSNGSAIPYFIHLIKHNKIIPLTDKKMTRFFISIDEAVYFVLQNFSFKLNVVMIPPKMKSASILDIIKTLGILLNKKPKIEVVGLRAGEKIHECLISQHDQDHIDSNTCPKYTIKELKELLRPML